MTLDIEMPRVGDTIGYTDMCGTWVVGSVEHGIIRGMNGQCFLISAWPGDRYVHKRAWQPVAGDRVRHKLNQQEGTLRWVGAWLQCVYDDGSEGIKHEHAGIAREFTKLPTASGRLLAASPIPRTAFEADKRSVMDEFTALDEKQRKEQTGPYARKYPVGEFCLNGQMVSVDTIIAMATMLCTETNEKDPLKALKLLTADRDKLIRDLASANTQRRELQNELGGFIDANAELIQRLKVVRG
jgi:hypothetical protein